MLSFASIGAIALAEIRTIRRLSRTWTFVVISCLIVVLSFVVMANTHATASAYSSTAGILGPRFQLSTYFTYLLFVFQIGVVFLAFDIYTRDVRERISDVIHSRPFSNLDLLIGRLLGITCFLVLVAYILVLVLASATFVLGHFDVSFKNTVEPYSTFSFLLLDLAPSLALCASLTIFLSLLLRLRFFIALLVITMLIGYAAVAALLPTYLFQPLASMTATVIPISDLTPQFGNGLVLWQRCSTIFLVAGLLALAAVLYPRKDEISKGIMLAAGIGCLLIGVGIRAVLVANAIATANEYDRLASVHEGLSTNSRADVVHLSGSVTIDPGGSLDVDYEISFTAPHEVGALMFAFNPGFEMESLVIDGQKVPYDFDDGLIRISSNSENSGEIHRLAISARGIPDVSFGYFDSKLNVNRQSAHQSRSLTLLGTEHAINHEDYVALTPAIKWYPTAGSAFHDENYELVRRDQFTLDLEVSVPAGWTIAGPGAPVERARNGHTSLRFAPAASLPDIALFGARFERVSTSIAGVKFQALFSPKHTSNVELFAQAIPVLEKRIDEMFAKAKDLGIPYPYEMLSVVEIPRSLRTYGGGWRMDNRHAYPGVFLVRETGFPTTNFGANLEVNSESESGTEHIAELFFEVIDTYFENDLSGGNPYITVTQNLFDFQTYPHGEGAHALAHLTSVLTSRLITARSGFFSTYYLGSQWGASEVQGFAIVAGLNLGESQHITDRAREWAINMPPVWEKIQSTSLADLDFNSESQLSLNALTLKCDAIADALISGLAERELANLLSTIRSRFAGKTYTVDDFRRIAHELQVDIDSVVGDWIFDHKLPGFQLYSPEVVRLTDTELGEPVYQTTFYLTNEEPTPGMFKLSFDERRETGVLPAAANQIPTLRVDGNSYSQVALHSEYPISYVRLHPYLSLNRETLEIEVDEPVSYEPSSTPRLPLISSVDWRPQQNDSVIIDDLDKGFSVHGQTPLDVPKPPWFIQLNELLEQREYSVKKPFDQGLPSWGYGGPIGELVLWHRESKRTAWGRYRKTAAVALPGDGSNKATFSATLPEKGRWHLDYHFPIGQKRLGIESRPPKRGNYYITIRNGEQMRSIEFDVSIAPHGWNRLGEYLFDDFEVDVSIVNRGETLVYADAIRWTRTSRPD